VKINYFFIINVPLSNKRHSNTRSWELLVAGDWGELKSTVLKIRPKEKDWELSFCLVQKWNFQSSQSRGSCASYPTLRNGIVQGD
jgi:hypothetical protein